jgi:hypothetical protein
MYFVEKRWASPAKKRPRGILMDREFQTGRDGSGVSPEEPDEKKENE